jgi:hypothetical protein
MQLEEGVVQNLPSDSLKQLVSAYSLSSLKPSTPWY